MCILVFLLNLLVFSVTPLIGLPSQHSIRIYHVSRVQSFLHLMLPKHLDLPESTLCFSYLLLAVTSTGIVWGAWIWSCASTLAHPSKVYTFEPNWDFCVTTSVWPPEGSEPYCALLGFTAKVFEHLCAFCVMILGLFWVFWVVVFCFPLEGLVTHLLCWWPPHLWLIMWSGDFLRSQRQLPRVRSFCLC